ncbi:hypothetical protein O163_00555 [Caldanaerobacter subterraneus subsp. yonseiensis KB-1]|uniref:Peptidase C39-like domain-containing protein n=1 Tax=Caldanaerobacter subterraneus subsp. yonseiensis KB-1 TaxID=1388761 RepID=U5CZA2_CALSX|nr:C39 family peptidase [Caldanaerobacter subterraneus]ERM93292.1 hypothetical protein O163_00555 [Caldanaerobacter subterraneus subsp. yonseiensis KB-1]
MMKNKRIKKFIGLVLFACLLSASVVFAEGKNDLQINEQYVKPSAEMDKKAIEKLNMFKERLRMAENTKTNNDNLIIQSYPDIPSSKQLSTNGYVGQPNKYTCGPTSAHNLLLTLGKNVSIDTLSNELGTTQDGTPFDTNRWSNVLNGHIGRSWYVGMWSPNIDSLWTAFVGDIIDGYPLILDIHISSSTAILPGYEGDPNINVWHYVTGVGYSGYYNAMHYVTYFDPNVFRQGAYGLHTVEVSVMQAAVRDRGIIY